MQIAIVIHSLKIQIQILNLKAPKLCNSKFKFEIQYQRPKFKLQFKFKSLQLKIEPELQNGIQIFNSTMQLPIRNPNRVQIRIDIKF